MIEISIFRVLTKNPATKKALTLYGYYGLPAMPIPFKLDSLKLLAQSVKNELGNLDGAGEAGRVVFQEKIIFFDRPGLPLEWCFPLSESERLEWQIFFKI